MDPLSEKITMKETAYSTDENFLHQGQERIIVLKEVTKNEKIVMRFSEKLPTKGIVWHDYGSLTREEKRLVDKLEPDMRKGGEPKSKFAHRWNLHFTDEKTGREFFKVFEGQKGRPDWEKCDIVFYTDVDNMPWGNFATFLKTLGMDDGEGTLGDFLKIGDRFTAVLMLGQDGYLHLDPETLTPMIDMDE